jgi:molybdate transport system substrate-binding protein
VALVVGHDTPEAKAFFTYMKGPEAAAVFKKYGFILLQ